jgi:hypothetical protein
MDGEKCRNFGTKFGKASIDNQNSVVTKLKLLEGFRNGRERPRSLEATVVTEPAGRIKMII